MAVPYIFRKYNTSKQNHTQDWSPGDVIDTDTFDVENIVFSKGSSKAGTSIPSPFARLELFDTAFRIVAADQSKKDNLNGTSIYHQLVSDCLDIFQLLFNAKNADIGVGKKIYFREWRVRENVDKLKSKGDQHPHALLAKSFEQVFFDKIPSAFTNTDSLFLIYYENRLLGGTSPLTLFFTSPNWPRYIQDGLILNIPQSADGDIFFDDSYRPLYLRDPEFVQYVYKLFVQNPHAFSQADGLRAYINKTVDIHFPGFKTDFEQYKRSNAYGTDYSGQRNLMEEEYTRLRTNVDNKELTINGLFIYHQQEGREKARIEKTSDFKIRATSTKYQHQYNDKGELQYIQPPLVLKNNMNLSGDYIEKNIPWKPETVIKDFYHRSIPLFERKLPQGNALTITYPFVTVEDFLEDVLIEMPYNINRGKFFTGFSGEFRYLLPVKKEYFNFFSLSDLKNALTITLNEGVVRVDLKIPIINKKGVPDISFIKQYSKEQGTITECRAGMGVFPFYQAAGELSGLSYLNQYKILLANRIETDHAQQKLGLAFFTFDRLAGDALAIPASVVPRSVQNRGGASATSRFYSVSQLFDYIELSYRYDDLRPAVTGLIIPDFEHRRYTGGNKEFTFAIDFGTSNTHVAYSQKDEPFPKPFEIEEADQQMVLLNAPGSDSDPGIKYKFYGNFPAIDATLQREFLPAIIRNKSKEAVSFPVKTASCEVEHFHNIVDKSSIDLFSHINIGYHIDREESPSSDIYTTDLKWLLENEGGSLSNQNRVKFFLKQLLLQIKIKTILNNGRLSKLKVVWSMPLSMSSGNRSALERILGNAFDEVFVNGDNSGATLMEPIPESVAPYFYLTQSPNGIKDTANAINIDIGGGTTDIMMFMESSGNRRDKYLTTSFRFAGNDLWGWGYKGKSKDNGFIKNYSVYRNVNNINPETETRYLRKAEADGNLKADDLVSLLFKYDEKFRFSDSITMGNPDLSLVLYLHYSAIIYHLLQIIELREYPLPRYLSFTGKGSQYIRLICGGSERSLREFTALLIKTYTGKDVQSWFSIHLNSNPKEITANGSVLYAQTIQEERDKYRDSVHFVHPGFDPATDPQFTDKTSGDGAKPVILKNILEINTPLNIAVLNNLNSFLDKTLTERNIIDFLAGFKIRNLKESLALLRWNGDIENGEGLIYDSYRKVLNGLRNEQKDHDTKLQESLFFFAFKDALYHLSKEIMSKKTV